MLLFLVPDDDSLDEPLREKALLDAEELKVPDAVPDKDKVELDLDDAPFLEEEDEEEEEEAPEPAAQPEEPEKKPKAGAAALLKDKRVLAGIGGGVLLVAILLVVLLWPSAEPLPPPPPPMPEPEQPVQPKEPEKPEFIVKMEPFWIEYQTDDGKIRLLKCSFATATDNEKLSWEIQTKTLVLRDAIYYYLRNKDLVFLSDKKNEEILKKELLSVMNQYLSTERLTTLLIQEYLVR